MLSAQNRKANLTSNVPGGNGARLRRGASSDIDEAHKGELSGESESIESAEVREFPESLRLARSRKAFPAGIEPTFKV
jgi:hypothetical protein